MGKVQGLTEQLHFLWHHYFEQFAQALAALPQDSWPKTGSQLWAAYRLGMCSTVAHAEWRGGHVFGDIAYAVSLAACGRGTQSSEFVQAIVRRHGIHKYLVTLADHLAPYLPHLSLQLLEIAHRELPTPLALQIALLLRCSMRDEARQRVGQLMERSDFGSISSKGGPELLLLASNALRDGPGKQLTRLNEFLLLQGLSPVTLIDNGKPPHVRNVRPLRQSQPVDGPLVTILLTAYNSGERIATALRGLREQTYRNIEVIAIDDASTDDTLKLIMEASRHDQRIRPLPMAVNVGTYAAKNIGFLHARGEFVVCHDSDDWSHPLRIEIQVAPLLADARLVATTSNWVRIQEDGTFYARPIHPISRLNPSSPLFRKELVENRAGLWDVVRTGADSEFLARLNLVFGNSNIKRIKRVLALGEHHLESLMNAKDSGYSTDGLSPQRLRYREAWAHWHIQELRHGRPPVMPPLRDLARGIRPFSLNSSSMIDQNSILSCLDGLPYGRSPRASGQPSRLRTQSGPPSDDSGQGDG
jgi:hypothetical protein